MKMKIEVLPQGAGLNVIGVGILIASSIIEVDDEAGKHLLESFPDRLRLAKPMPDAGASGKQAMTK